MRPLKVGKFRQRVQLFDVPETTQDAWGQPSLNSTQIAGPGVNGSFAAEVRPLKGDEQLNVRQIWPTATHLVTMRWLGSAVPPSFNGTGNLTANSNTVNGFAASFQGINLTPIAGEPVYAINSNAIPAATTVAGWDATNSVLTMSAAASLNATNQAISVGSFVNNPFGWIIPRMYLIDLDGGNQLNILFAENIEMRNRAWRLTCAEKVNI